MQYLDLFRVRKSRLHAAQVLKRANHQAGADQQHERERHLRHDQRVARSVALAAIAERSADTRSAVAIRGCGISQRDGAEEHAREQRHTEGERQHERIDADVAQPRQRIRTFRDQDLQRPIRQAETRCAAEQSQRHAFDEQRPCDRPRPAPSAARIASSCWRASARTSNRLATFAQAIKRTSPSVAITTHSAVPMSPTMSCFSGRARPEASVLKHRAIHSWIRRPRVQPDSQHAGHIGVRLLHGDAGFEPRDALIVEEAQRQRVPVEPHGRISSGSR